MKGRLTGTPEARKAAEYILNEFKKSGLQPPPGQSDYFQKFEFTSGVTLGSPNAMQTQFNGATADYVLQKDFIPTGFSSDGILEKVSVSRI
jgi:hypothetical protein